MTVVEPCQHVIVRNDQTGDDECTAGCGWVIPAPPAPPQPSGTEPETVPAGPGEAWQEQPENTGWDDTPTGPA